MEFIGALITAFAAAGPVVKGLGEFAVGAKNLASVALDLFRRKHPEKQQAAALRVNLEAIANMPEHVYARQVEQIVAKEMADKPAEQQEAAIELALLAREKTRTRFAPVGADPTDPNTQAHIPAHFDINNAEQLVQTVIPLRLSQFRAGQLVPNNDRWVLVRKLAIGGFGEVWLARGVEERYLLSVFKFPLDPVAQRRIIENERENIRRVSNELKKERHIVKLLDSHLKGDTPWLHYEYIPGGDLAKHFHTWPKEADSRVTKAIATLKVLAGTVARLHTIKLVHRDLKPQNVLLDDDGDLMITDLGISDTQSRQAIDEANIGTILGQTDSTPTMIRYAHSVKYASPQQIEGAASHTSDDVHALGVMLYQMVVGDIYLPMRKGFHHTLTTRHIARPLIDLIATATADLREDRFQHAGELLEALERLPSKLVVAPEIIDPAVQQQRDNKSLFTQFEAKVAEAKAKNQQARALFNQRQWKPAKAVLDEIFHDVLRDRELYKAVCLYAEGKRYKNSVGMEFAWVPPGDSWLGGGGGTPGTRQFTLEQGFWAGVFPVTQAEWKAVMGSESPSHFKGPRLPVESVSWDTITQQFLPALNKKCQAEGYEYRLPTEDEWEYLCRGGPITQVQSAFSYYFAKSKTDLTPNPTNDLTQQMANFGQGNGGKTCEVGLYLPNPLGIYDLVGNVWEWTASAHGSSRVFRGGSWRDSADYCSAAYRDSYSPVITLSNLGFRLLAVPLV